MKTVDFKSTLLENIEKPTQRVDFKAVDPTHNEGGILGGIGYVVGKALTGIASVGEGITDLVAGGIAELSGDHRKATYIFGHSEVGEWNKALDDWYNPDDVMSVVGEIGGAVGNSLAFAGATAAGTAIGAPWLGYAVIGASGVGGGIGEAVQETGQLGAKEYIFGTLAGATELGLEAFTGATVKAGARLAGKGASKVGASVVGKRVLSNSTRRGFIRTTVTEASEEFIEEFASTYANVAWRHVTGVDPDAQYSLGDATYAGLIGFVSGGLMSGTSQGVQNAISGHRGARIMDNGNTDTMLNTAKYVIGKFGSDTAVKSKQNVTDALVQLTNAYEAYGKLKDKSGVRAKLYLGEMQRASAQLEARARAMYASDEFLAKAKADTAEAQHYADVLNAVLQPDTAFTAEDIVNNKELSKGTSVCDMLGYMKFAGEFMDETRRKAEYAEAMQEAENAAEVVQTEESAEEELPFVGPSDQQSAESTEAPATQESALAVPQTEAGEGRQSPAPANAQETQNLPSSDGSVPKAASTPATQEDAPTVAQEAQGTGEQSPAPANTQEREISAPDTEHVPDALTRTNGEKMQATDTPTAKSAESADTAQISERAAAPGEGTTSGMDAVAAELRAGIQEAREQREAAEAERAAKQAARKAAKKQTSEKTSAKKHTKLELKEGEKADSVLESYQNAIDTGIVHFVDSIDSMTKKSNISKRKYSMGKISANHAKMIQEILRSEVGIDMNAEGYSLYIDGSTVKHIQERHGESGSADHSLASKEDIARIGWVVNHADNGYIARKKDGEIDYSTQYKNSDGSQVPKIVFEKTIEDGKVIVVECAPASGTKKVHIISARKIKNGNGQVLNMDSSESPQPTSETLLDGIAAIDSIPQNGDSVNTSLEISSEKAEKTENANEKAEAAAENTEENTEGVSETARAEARKHVENFDLYPPEVRRNIEEMLTSAEGVSMKEVERRALCKILCVRPGLRIFFDDTLGVSGLHHTMEKDPTHRIILVRPSDALKTTIVHELVHDLEEDDAYGVLAALADRATTAERKAEIELLYYNYDLKDAGLIDADLPSMERVEDVIAAAGMKDTELELLRFSVASEVRATVIAEMLTENEKINLFASESPGVIARMWGRGKRLLRALRAVTPNGAAYREARRIQKSFENAVLDKGKSPAWLRRVAVRHEKDEEEKEATKLSIEKTTDGKRFVEIERDILNGVPKADWIKTVKQNLKAKFPNGVTVGNNVIDIDSSSRREMTFSEYMQGVYKKDAQIHLDKLRATDQADEILYATDDWVNEAPKHARKDDITDFATGTVYLRVGANDYRAKVVVGYRKNGKMRMYDIINLSPTTFTKKEISETPSSETDIKHDSGIPQWASKISDTIIPDSSENVNTSTEKSSKPRLAIRKENSTRSEKETNRILKEAAGEIFTFLKRATKRKLVEELHAQQYKKKTVEAREKFAQDIAERIYDAYEAEFADAKSLLEPDAALMREQLDIIEPYIASVTFSADELAEMQRLYGKQMMRSIKSRWSLKKNSEKQTHTLDEAIQRMVEEVPAFEEMSEWEPIKTLYQMNEIVEDAQDILAQRESFKKLPKKKNKDAVITSVSASIADALQRSADVRAQIGKGVYPAMLDVYATAEERAREAERKFVSSHKLLKAIEYKANLIKEYKKGKLLNATEYKSEIFKRTFERMGDIMRNDSLNESATREMFGMLDVWYAEENSLLQGCFRQEIKEILGRISSGEGGFSVSDMRDVYNVLTYVLVFFKEYDKVWRQGKLVEAKPLAEAYIAQMKADESIGLGRFEKFMRMKLIQKWRSLFSDPPSLVRFMDRYERGFYTDMYEELRRCEIAAAAEELDMKKEYSEFSKKHRRYIVKAEEEKVKYREKEISRMQLISLYMTMNREQAWNGICVSGVVVKDEKGNDVRIEGLFNEKEWEGEIERARQRAEEGGGTIEERRELEEKLLLTDVRIRIKKEQEAIRKLLTKDDLSFIEILERGFVKAGAAKARMDVQRLGFSNVSHDYYYPIRRAYMSKESVDSESFMSEAQRVSNARFNKNIVKGARQELMIESADKIFTRHISAVAQYANLATVVELYDRLRLMNIGENANHVETIESTIATVDSAWKEGHEYFKEMFSDVQGIPKNAGAVMKGVGTLRGKYATTVLGANPKTILTQFSSLIASTSLLDASSVAQGTHTKSEDVFKYCKLAEIRALDNSAAKASAVVDNIGRVSEFTMKGIEMTDAFIVRMLFGACQVQIAKDGGAAVGTEANKVEAGKLLERVILETQQNALATERSAAMRSQNEFLRSVTMFSSDAMKVFGRVQDAVCENMTLRYRISKEKDAKKKAEYQKRLPKSNKKMVKAIAALTASAAFMVLIAELFRFLYAKEDEEDESTAKRITVDFVGNMVGGLPLIKEFHSVFIEGYDLESYSYASINEILDTAKATYDLVPSIISGEASREKIADTIKRLVFTSAYAAGIPARNVYNTATGLLRRVSPDSAYHLDAFFKEQSYSKDLAEAVEEGDTSRAATILEIALGKRLDGSVTDQTLTELHRLTMQGYDVLPRTVSDSITVKNEEGEDVTHELTGSEKSAVRDSYGDLQIKSLDTMIKSAAYASFDDVAKAKSVAALDKLCYDLSVLEETGIEKNLLSCALTEELGADKLALIFGARAAYESDKDESGKTVAGSKREKIMRVIASLGLSAEDMILAIYAAGYTPKDGDVQGVSAAKAKEKALAIISQMSVSANAKLELAKMCGFVVENGRVVAA